MESFDDYQFQNLKFVDNLDFINPPVSGNCRDASRIIVFGSPGSGKSSFVKNVCYEKRNSVYSIHAICNTNDCNGFYDDFVPKMLIYSSSDANAFDEWFKWRTRVIKSNPIRKVWDILICDDCSYDTKLKTDVNQRKMARNGRHFQVLYMLVLQSFKDVPKDALQHYSGYIIFPPTEGHALQTLYESFVSQFDSKKEFFALMKYIKTLKYTCIWIPSTITTENKYDSMFLYKTKRDGDGKDEIPKAFTVGNSEFKLAYKFNRPDIYS